MCKQVNGQIKVMMVPSTDPRSLENQAYGTLILLSRVIVQLGELSPVTPEDLEGLFLTDWQYLQEVYNAINPPKSGIFTTGEL